MADRTETCTPEERRLLDLLGSAIPTRVEATHNSLLLRLEDWPLGYGSGHAAAQAFYEVQPRKVGKG